MITIALLLSLIILAIVLVVQNGIISSKLTSQIKLANAISDKLPEYSWSIEVYNKLKQIMTLTDNCHTRLIAQRNKMEDLTDKAVTLTNLSTLTEDLTDKVVRMAVTLTNLSILTEDSFKGTADIMNKVSPMIDRLAIIENILNNLYAKVGDENTHVIDKLVYLEDKFITAIGQSDSIALSLTQIIDNISIQPKVEITVNKRVWDYFHGKGTIIKVKANKTFVVLFDSGHEQTFNEYMMPISNIGFRTLLWDVVRCDSDSTIDAPPIYPNTLEF